ncbi:MAG: UvrABC system protein A [Parcubacteria group bacterium GW2011_GWB2_40_8]|nr:MAG: UvrABC system protein A [Parcubacteria group bacterium GW2011_GWF2_40_10]KKR47820.1 MAG: UvrABC system protein A [Parcubacteria group bacterium GW2011_GWA2_40_143]KKR60251.1 MAG: UvrABC system protein A [Parcubacteria group bacterium GW2011_GWC2_40_31]KKR74493.1 MAG: UvrABC system protein A [Parcubacteria group bacterium GW2011_GWB2_40_8]KKR77399.1 MAG: UvrABC system protein A [Parcubacteria group bacterium GW2011_GWE2_40_8]
MLDKIIIKGARVHNLKNISLEIPKNKLVVFTGVSGSGKSSLAFDTIFAEGQRRYIESLSPYARPTCKGLGKTDLFLNEVCPDCDGKRLKPEGLSVKINGKSIQEVSDLII